jgi:hypothetical protein
MADAVAANTVARPVPASASSTAMDHPAGRPLRLPLGLASLADLRARLLFQNDRMVSAFVSSTIGPMSICVRARTPGIRPIIMLARVVP